VTYLIMAGCNFYPSPPYDPVAAASSRAEAEEIAADFGKTEDYVVVYEIDDETKEVRRYEFPGTADRVRKLVPWTLVENARS